MSIDVDWEAVEAFQATDAYRRLGVLGRWRLLCETFPSVEARWLALGARHVEASVFGMDPPVTPDPDA